MALILRRDGGDTGGPEPRRRNSARRIASHPAIVSVLPSSSGSKKVVSTKSKGGGKPYKLPKSSPFAERPAGGGKRTGIYGTSHYGSGYSYGASGSYVAGRPLVYVFWPVPIQEGYYGGDEYARNQSERPGGNIVVATIKSNSSTDTYRIIGDNLSVIAVYYELSVKCGVLNTEHYITSFTGFDDTAFNATNNASLPKPEQIIQWYRASTFGLALDGYNNTAALRLNMPTSNASTLPSVFSTPLPATLNAVFLMCLNDTIGSNLPLVVVPRGLSSLDKSAIAFAGVVMSLLLLVICYVMCAPPILRRSNESHGMSPRNNVRRYPS